MLNMEDVTLTGIRRLLFINVVNGTIALNKVPLTYRSDVKAELDKFNINYT